MKIDLGDEMSLEDYLYFFIIDFYFPRHVNERSDDFDFTI